MLLFAFYCCLLPVLSCVFVVVCVLLLFLIAPTLDPDFKHMCVRFFCLIYIQNIDRMMSVAGGVGELLAGRGTTVLLLVGATDYFTATYRLRKTRISRSV